ncbi:MAG: protein kinase [Acidobacteriota bacterium]
MLEQSISHYQIIKKLGAGGMGEVYLAEDIQLGRHVALKLLPTEVAFNEGSMRRFSQEARAASALNHPNILTVYEFGEVDSIHFIATEFIDGLTLRQRMEREPISVGDALDVAVQVTAALTAAHGADIVHRDIKPENIMMRADGYIKVLDFGLAKLTERRAIQADAPTLIMTDAGVVMGTARYMSPEQARGLSVDARTDIWSLGVVLYEMVTGRAPFEGNTTTDTIVSILEREPLPLAQFSPEIPTGLQRIVTKALAKKQAERYQTAQDLSSDLKRLKRASEAGGSSEPTQATSVVRTSRRVFARAWFIALVGILALGLAVAGYLNRGRFFSEVAPTASAKQITLAVLPFRILNKEAKDLNFLGLGFPDAIISRLANVRQIRMRPTSAILRYENQDVDAQEAGRVLSSDYVVMGTVQEVEENLRVSVQLLQVSDGTPIWGAQYDEPRAVLLDMQDSIAGQVAAALKIKMTVAEQERLRRRYTENAAAYESYLQGRSHLARSTQEEALAAIAKFEKALQIDPNYAPAYAGLARAAAEMHLRFAPEPEVKGWGERAEREARRALELDTNLAETHLALAAVYGKTDFNWEATIEESSRTLDLDPNLDLAYAFRARAFYHLGLLELADRDLRAGLEINAENRNRVELLRTQGIAALLGGEYAQASSLLEEAQRLNGKPLFDVYLAQAHYYQGGATHAQGLLDELRHSSSASAQARARATLASFLAARGSRTQAEELLRGVISGGYMDHHAAYSVGATYAQLGQRSEALGWLRKAADTGFPCYPWYARDPLLQPLGGDPEFQRFIAALRKSWESAKARYTP